ncbi:TPA: hypothetical protein ACGKF1_000722 [Streptococcus pneumoniae]
MKKARIDSEILEELLEKNKVNYLDANQYAIEIGEILAKVLGAYLSNINQEDVERRKQIGIESAEERKRKRDERIAKFGNPRRRLS